MLTRAEQYKYVKLQSLGPHLHSPSLDQGKGMQFLKTHSKLILVKGTYLDNSLQFTDTETERTVAALYQSCNSKWLSLG